jgi:hypothetical protein
MALCRETSVPREPHMRTYAPVVSAASLGDRSAVPAPACYQAKPLRESCNSPNSPHKSPRSPNPPHYPPLTKHRHLLSHQTTMSEPSCPPLPGTSPAGSLPLPVRQGASARRPPHVARRSPATRARRPADVRQIGRAGCVCAGGGLLQVVRAATRSDACRPAPRR